MRPDQTRLWSVPRRPCRQVETTPESSSVIFAKWLAGPVPPRFWRRLLPSPPLSPFRQRQDENAPRKQALAKVAASLVQPNQVLLIDAGSTNNAIAAALPERHGLTVATNAPSIAQQLMAREGFEVMLVGGRIDISAGGSVGAEALDQLRRIRADVCFPGACAIDSARGLWGMDMRSRRIQARLNDV